MARVLTAFFNSMDVQGDPNAMPAFYESFIQGMMNNGNDVQIYSHKYFGIKEFAHIDTDPAVRDAIKNYSPDICFLFNNCFYDISDIVDCPIVVYEVDSPQFFSNIEILKQKKDRFIYFVSQTSSRDYLRDKFEIEDKYIFDVPFFTEIYAQECEFERNIGFIGSNFVNPEASVSRIFDSNANTLKDRLIYYKILDIIETNPNCDVAVIETLLNAIESDVLKRYDSQSIKKALLNELSGERRIRVLGTIRPLGLELFGTPSWVNTYYANTELARSFNHTRIYSKNHNEYIYNTSRIGINVSHLQAVTGFPWRIMDILASNACLVTDYHLGFESVFGTVAKLIPVYENPGDAYAVCKDLLNDEERRRYITLACREVVNDRYRFKNCLELIEQYAGVMLHKEGK